MSIVFLGVVFAVIIALLALKRPLWQATCGGLVAIVLLYRMPISAVLGQVGRVFSVWGNLSVILALYVITYLQRMLEANGLGFEDVVKTTCFLADMGDFAAFNGVYGQYFVSKPARSCVAVKTLPKNVLCEIELIAKCKD